MNRSRARAIRRKYRKRTRVTVQKAWILSALAAAVIIYGAAALIRERGREAKGTQVSIETPDSTQMSDVMETGLLGDVSVGNLKLSGLTMEQAASRVREVYRWDMRVLNGEESVSLEDLAGPQLEEILETIKQGDKDKPQSYELDYERLEQAFVRQAAELAREWDRGAVDSQMESFDKETKTYRYTQERYGRSLKQEQLVEELMEAARKGEFRTEIQASFDSIAPKRTAAQARDQYKVIGTFSTTTTDNKNRNQNIRLASEAIDGVVLKPGEEFSFNLATGNRTSEKGYQPAGAYRNGVLIEEPGGGVCQVSTTLYHAIINSGYKTTERNFHSFAPGYIDKGQDAMVSFDGYAGPDLKFVNTQSTSIGLRASFDGKQLKLSIVGLPLLEENERISMRSEKIRELEPPAPVYEENPELAYGEEKIVEQAQPGSVWKSYRIRTKNGQVEEETFLYTSTYKAKPARIQRNSAALPPSEEPPQADPGENVREGQTAGEAAENSQEGQTAEAAAENVREGQTAETAAEEHVIMPFGS